LRAGEGSKETSNITGIVEIIPIHHKTRELMTSSFTSFIMKTLILLRKLQKNQKNGREEDNSAFKSF
jgi:hypothetical protein